MKNILTLKIQCFCTHQEEAASQRNYHISEYLKEIKQKKEKANHYILFALPFKVLAHTGVEGQYTARIFNI